MKLLPHPQTIRRWCRRCRNFTYSWTDMYGHERCQDCDPPTHEHQGGTT